MRNDMMKVVAEPARGGRPYRKPKGEKVRLQREGIDSAQREPMSPGWIDWDDRSRDHLKALRRFLHKQVGRRWDEVYSEICQSAPAGSFLGYHLRELVSSEVEVSVSVDGDELRGRNGWKVYNGDLYVCPQTNILMTYDDGSRRKRYRWRDKNEYEMLAVDESHKYVKIDGLWYLISLSPIPGPEVSERPFDVVLKESAFAVDPGAHRYQNRFLRVWGGPFYASAKQQANKREIRQIEAALAEGAKVFAGRSRVHSEGRCIHRQPARR